MEKMKTIGLLSLFLMSCLFAGSAVALPESGEAGVHARLSQQYSMTNQPVKALAEIEEAVRLAPDNPDYLKARAQIANWLGRYRIAGESYERLLALTPKGSSYGLMLARSRTWQGDLDGAARAYRDYVQTHGEDSGALLEFARVEGWRGNLAAGIKLLDLYEQRFPALPKADNDRARLLAWANKPRTASRINDELLVKQPDDYELNATRTIALDKANDKREAVKSLKTLKALRPDSAEVGEIARYVNTPLRPDLTVYGRYYEDADSQTMWEESARAGYSLSPATRVGVMGDWWQLSADPGSGLENRDGSSRAEYQKGMVSIAHAFRPSLWVDASAGVAGVGGSDSRFVYDLLVGGRLGEDLKVSLEQERDNLLISARSASLGITRDTSRVQVEWTPGLDTTVAGLFRYDDYSDGNERWEAVLGPRRSVVRSQLLDLDLGVRGMVFGYNKDLNSGYYDPSLYEQYALTAFSYWKFTQDSGLSLIGAAGYCRDDSMNHYDFGWSGDAELILGANRRWSAKAGGHYMENFRSEGGSYHALAVDLSITRRF